MEIATVVGDIGERAAQHVAAALQLDPDDNLVKQRLKKLRKGTTDAARVVAEVELAPHTTSARSEIDWGSANNGSLSVRRGSLEWCTI